MASDVARVADADAVNFWNQYFGSDREVETEKFANALALTFPKFPETIVFRVVDHFIGKAVSLEPIRSITVKDWVDVLEKFGPFANVIHNVTRNFFDKNGDVHSWFHFQLDREHSRRRMRLTDTFLVREGASRKNSFVLQYTRTQSGMKDLLLIARHGEFLINPSDDATTWDKCDKTDNLLEFLKTRTDRLVPTPSTLSQTYTCVMPERKDQTPPSVYEPFVVPSSFSTGLDYASYASQKAKFKQQAEKVMGNYVTYGTNQSILPTTGTGIKMLSTGPQGDGGDGGGGGGGGGASMSHNYTTVQGLTIPFVGGGSMEEKYPSQPRTTAVGGGGGGGGKGGGKGGVGGGGGGGGGAHGRTVSGQPNAYFAYSNDADPSQVIDPMHVNRGGASNSPPAVRAASHSMGGASNNSTYSNPTLQPSGNKQYTTLTGGLINDIGGESRGASSVGGAGGNTGAFMSAVNTTVSTATSGMPQFLSTGSRAPPSGGVGGGAKGVSSNYSLINGTPAGGGDITNPSHARYTKFTQGGNGSPVTSGATSPTPVSQASTPSSVPTAKESTSTRLYVNYNSTTPVSMSTSGGGQPVLSTGGPRDASVTSVNPTGVGHQYTYFEHRS